MAFSTHVGREATPTSDGNVAYTGCGFQPKVLLFWYGNASGQTLANYNVGFGAAISASSRFATHSLSVDGAATSECKRKSSNTKCVVMTLSTGADHIDGDLVSMDADGFTINWNYSSGGAMGFYYLALGGSDLTNVAIKEFQSPASTGSVAYTGVGFRPDCLIVAGINHTSSVATTDHSVLALGFANAALEQGAVFNNQTDNLADSDTKRHSSISKVIEGGTANSETAALTSMDADGFTLNWTRQNTNNYFWAVCLRGGSYKIGQFTERTTNGTLAVTGVGFKPRGLFLLDHTNTTNGIDQDGAYIGIGAGDAALNTTAYWAGDNDAAATMTSDSSEFPTLHRNYLAGTPTIIGAATLTSLDNDGWTETEASANGDARLHHYLAFGNTKAGSSGGGQGGGRGGGSGGGGSGGGTGGNPGQPPKKTDARVFGTSRRRRHMMGGF